MIGGPNNTTKMKPLTQAFIENCQRENVPIGMKTKLRKSFVKISTYTTQVLCNILPAVSVIRNYKIKSFLINDAIAGLTVSFMQLPQGMAYASEAQLPIQTGLFMGCFPAICYFLFGSSKHLSFGAIVVISMMFGSLMDDRFQPIEIPLEADNQTVIDTLSKEKLKFATAITLIAGFTQLAMSVLRLGFLIKFLSSSMISAFSAGISFHVATSQLKNIVRVSIPRYRGRFLSLPKTMYDLCLQLPNSHYPSVLLSLATLFIIYVVKSQINERFKHRLRIPIPIDLIIVLIITPISYALKLEEVYDFKVVGDIPSGIPPPTLPDISYAKGYISESITIGIVAFVYSISVALIISRKEGYKVDANQELFAYGITNIVISFFGCFTPSGSVSRSSVLIGCGAKSQVANLVGCQFLLIVIFFLSPLLRTLPTCVLACIILVALRSMLNEVFNFRKVWRICKYDGMVWLVTFAGVILTSVGVGLFIGVVFGIIFVTVRTLRVKAVPLGILSNTNVFLDKEKYPEVTLPCGITIVSFSSPIYYANVDIFRKEIDGRIQKMKEMNDNSNAQMEENVNLKVIIECSGIAFIDGMGAAGIQELYNDYKNDEISCVFTNVNENVISVLKASGAFNTLKHVMYLSTSDAMMAASSETNIVDGHEVMEFMNKLNGDEVRAEERMQGGKQDKQENMTHF